MTGFEYPTGPHTRRHWPVGYNDYDSYREWLRDEFTFRCVYCLYREQWCNLGTAFHVEHLLPVKVAPEGRCEYSNLLYACAACNEAKHDIPGVPDPCQVTFRECLFFVAEGRVEARSREGEKLIQILRLNSRKRVDARARWMRTLQALRTSDPLLYQEYMGFPEDLPDLRKKRPPGNRRPEGATNCYYALRERGELQVTF